MEVFRPHDFVFFFWFLTFFLASYWQLTNSSQHTQQNGKPEGTTTAYVYKVTQDNRILATIHGTNYTIRLQDISLSSERNVRMFMKEKLVGQQIELEYGEPTRDTEGNIIAYVWIGEEMLNQILIQKGYARPLQTSKQTGYIQKF
jgi:endonuclease YncB( thermonuclease family)